MAGNEFLDLFTDSGLNSGAKLFNYIIQVKFNPAVYGNITYYNNIPPINKWKKIHYLDKRGNESQEFKNLPRNKCGVFMWIIKPRAKFPQTQQSLVVYIGRSDKCIKNAIEQFMNNGNQPYRGDLSVKALFDNYSKDLLLMYYIPKKPENTYNLCISLNKVVEPPINYIDTVLDEEGENI